MQAGLHWILTVADIVARQTQQLIQLRYTVYRTAAACQGLF